MFHALLHLDRPAPVPRAARSTIRTNTEQQRTRVHATENAAEVALNRPAWIEAARCRGQTNLFFASFGERPERRVIREVRARAVCRPGCSQPGALGFSELVDRVRRGAAVVATRITVRARMKTMLNSSTVAESMPRSPQL